MRIEMIIELTNAKSLMNLNLYSVFIVYATITIV